MPRAFVHIAFFLFIITALSGVFMRGVPFMLSNSIPYENVLHAHSHLAILGWAFLGAFIILLSLLWPELKQRKHSIFLTMTLFVVSIVMFGAFVYEGYAKYSIIMSTAHLFVEYWAVVFIYQQLKLQNKIPKISKLFIKGSLVTLVISTFGPFFLGYLGATGLRESPIFDMTIYFYLHFQYNGWLFLFLIGVFLFILDRKGIKLHIKLLKNGFWIYFISLFPWYLSAISFSKPLATLGLILQWIGVLLIITAVRRAWKSIVTSISKLTNICLYMTFLLLFLKSTMELGLIFTPLADLVFETRSVIIGYLHFTLLGFVSLFILTQYQIVHIIDTNRKSVIIGFIIFLFGFLFNELYLFMMGLTSWLNITGPPYYTAGLLISSILLLTGIGFLWYSFLNRKKPSL